MNKKYGIKINDVWVFYILMFNPDGSQKSGKYHRFKDGTGGNNYPRHEQLITDGYRLIVQPDYNQNTHKLVVGSYSVIDSETAQQDIVDLTPDELVVKHSSELNRLLADITTVANAKVDIIISPAEKPHWMGVSDALSRKHHVWLEECLAADIESRMPDEVTYTPLTYEEHQIWFSLSLVQISTCAVREAAMAIAAILNVMPTAEILTLPGDWVSAHQLWPVA